jgi:hypothetical protein
MGGYPDLYKDLAGAMRLKAVILGLVGIAVLICLWWGGRRSGGLLTVVPLDARSEVNYGSRGPTSTETRLTVAVTNNTSSRLMGRVAVVKSEALSAPAPFCAGVAVPFELPARSGTNCSLSYSTSWGEAKVHVLGANFWRVISRPEQDLRRLLRDCGLKSVQTNARLHSLEVGRMAQEQPEYFFDLKGDKPPVLSTNRVLQIAWEMARTNRLQTKEYFCDFLVFAGSTTEYAISNKWILHFMSKKDVRLHTEFSVALEDGSGESELWDYRYDRGFCRFVWRRVGDRPP